jgi:hypothetical protein
MLGDVSEKVSLLRLPSSGDDKRLKPEKSGKRDGTL